MTLVCRFRRLSLSATTLLAGLLALPAIDRAEGAVLVAYQMGQANPQVQDPLNGAAGGDLTNGGGFGTFNVSATHTYASAPVLQVNPNAGGVATNASDAFAGNAFIRFTVTVGSGVALMDLTNISFQIARGGDSGRGFGLRVTTPTTTNQTLVASTAVPTIRPNFTNQSIDLTPFASLQNLSTGDVVTFELAVYTPSTGNSMELDNITISGNTVAIPEPSLAGLALLGIAGLFRRRR
jgi:uncharacterized protein (TIGR03382 family)